MGGGMNRLQHKGMRAKSSLRRGVRTTSQIRKKVTTATVGLHRGRKKRIEAKERSEKKRQFVEAELAKLNEMVEAKRAEAKRVCRIKKVGPALAVLPDLAAALPDMPQATDNPRRATNSQSPAATQGAGSKGGMKHRQWASKVIEEREQMRRVMNHDAFVNTGLDALTSHLSNTVSCQAAQIPPSLSSSTPCTRSTNATSLPPPSASAMHNADQMVVDNKIRKEKRRGKKRHGEQMDQDGSSTLRLTSVANARRQYKKEMAELALRKGAKKRGQVVQQSVDSLLGNNDIDKMRAKRNNNSRGRIGEKRQKDLS